MRAFILMICLYTPAHGIPADGRSSEPLVHVSADQILVCDEGIFAQVSGELIELPDLIATEQGLATSALEEAQAWDCPICSGNNKGRYCKCCLWPIKLS